MGKKTVLYWWINVHIGPGVASTVMSINRYLREKNQSIELLIMGIFFIATGITMYILKRHAE